MLDTHGGENRHRRAVLCLVALAFLGLACDMGGLGNVASVRDSAGIRIVLSDLTDGSVQPKCEVDSEPTLRIGERTGAAEYELYRVTDAHRFHDGRVAVLGRGTKDVRVFDSSGTFRLSLGGEGEGPGEFRDPIQMAPLAGDSLAVWDWKLGRVSIFTMDGAFVRAIRLEPGVRNPTGHFGILATGPPLVVAFHDFRRFSGREFVDQYLQLLRYGRDGLLVDTIATLPYGRFGWVDPEARMMGSPLFEARGTFAAAGDRLFLSDGAEPEVQVWDTDLTLRRIVRWRPQDRRVSADEIREYRRRQQANAAEGFQELTRQRLEAVPVGEVFPAVVELKSDPVGQMWVRQYTRPFATEQTWWAFDEKGVARCALALPRRFTVLEFGEDWVLGKTTDEFDSEHVEVFAVEGMARTAGRDDT